MECNQGKENEVKFINYAGGDGGWGGGGWGIYWVFGDGIWALVKERVFEYCITET